MTPMKTVLEVARYLTETKWKPKKNCERYYGHIVEALGIMGTPDIKLDTLTQPFVDGWRSRIRDAKKRASTANRIRTSLSSVFKAGGLNLEIPVFPVSTEKMTRHLTDDDLALVDSYFKNQVANNEAKAVYVVLRETGARGAEELGAIQRENLDWVGKMITLRSAKGSRGDYMERRVPMTEKAEKALSWLYHNTPEHLNLFRPKMMRQFASAFREMADALFPGDVKVKPYSLRHTLAMRLHTKGIPIHTIAQILGHKSPETTLHYLHNSPNYSSEVMNALL